MTWLASIFGLTALGSGVAAIFNIGFWPGLAGTLAPLLALIGGGGITTPGATGFPKLGTILVGSIMLALSIWWLRSQGWQLDLFGFKIAGTVQAVVGFILGLGFGFTDRGEPGLFTAHTSGGGDDGTGG